MINSVRNTVLSVLNKNNYGYISPSDFNLYAKQAQLELFEEYFSNYNKVINAENTRTSGTGYASLRRMIEETIETFAVTNILAQSSGNIYFSPSLSTTNDEFYMINRVLCYPTILASGTNSTVVLNSLVDTSAQFTSLGIVPGDIVVNVTTGLTATVTAVASSISLNLSSNIFLSTGNRYAVIDISVFKEAEKVSQTKISMLLNSNLTSPNTLFPAFVQEGDKITVYPDSYSIKGQVQANYFRLPKDPKWTYISLVGGSPVFDQTQPDYQDFELPSEDEYRLATKILEYCGISIREAEVMQFGMYQQDHEEPTFGKQQ